MTSRTRAAPTSTSNSRSARPRTWSAMRRRSGSSSSRRLTPAASAAGSRGGTRKPSSPSCTWSGMAPTAVTTIGTPAAMASGITSGNASVHEGETNTLAETQARAFSSPSSEPRNVTRSGEAAARDLGAQQRLLRVALGHAAQQEAGLGVTRQHRRDGVEQLPDALGGARAGP